ncbi:MAG: LuxR C-terminal-related transcriptional regulator, partial [Chloroflexi bacterium]|nr:LuxR C-terminal-related transcriptional regulator [Chloroflexota bacterium]
YSASAQRTVTLPSSLEEQQDFMAARMLIADEKPDAALELLERWRVNAHEHGRTSGELASLTLQALAYAAGSNKDQAIKALVRALTLGRARGYLRVFLDEGAKMQFMISDLRFRIETQAPRLRGYVYTLLSAFSTEIPTTAPKSEILNPKSAILFEPLSPQEQRVLRLLTAGMSNPEIARELVVSTNTIKTQVQSIYRKLNVSNRAEARDIAREINLL